MDAFLKLEGTSWLVQKDQIAKSCSEERGYFSLFLQPPRVPFSDEPVALNKVALWITSNLLSSLLSRESK